jgi:hypothetical protein
MWPSEFKTFNAAYHVEWRRLASLKLITCMKAQEEGLYSFNWPNKEILIIVYTPPT